jgi:hypothetical protein
VRREERDAFVPQHDADQVDLRHTKIPRKTNEPPLSLDTHTHKKRPKLR